MPEPHQPDDAPPPDAPARTAAGSDGLPFVYDPPIEPAVSAGGLVVDALRRRPAGRALISGLSLLLFLSGAGMFSYPFFTDLYTDQVVQDRLEGEFESRMQAAADEDGGDDEPGWEAVEAGDPVTRIAIPTLDVETVVVSGTSPSALRAGAGHYTSTPLPGEEGNVGIAGHRTTYGRPFNQIEQLAVGDEIWMQTPIGDFAYEVAEPPTDGDCEAYAGQAGAPDDTAACITHPRDWDVVSQEVEGAALTLTSCHPKHSAAQRIIIRAELAGRHEPGTYEERHGGDDEDGDAEA